MLTRVSVNYWWWRLCMLIYKLCCVYQSCQNGKKNIIFQRIYHAHFSFFILLPTRRRLVRSFIYLFIYLSIYLSLYRHDHFHFWFSFLSMLSFILSCPRILTRFHKTVVGTVPCLRQCSVWRRPSLVELEYISPR